MNYPFYLKMINPRSRVRIPLIYQHRELGKTVALFSDGSVKLFSKTSSESSIYSEAMVISGSATNAEFSKGIMPYQFDDLDFQSAMDSDSQKFISFLAQHPNVKCDIDELLMVEVNKGGKRTNVKVDKGSSVPYFELVVPEMRISKKVSSVKRKTTVSQHFLSLSEEEMSKVCWSFEVDPRFKSQDEIIDIMIGDEGVLFQTSVDNGVSVENIDTYLNKFVDGDALNDADMARSFAIKEAMEISKLEQDPFEYREGNFYHGDKFLGSNFGQVEAFFSNNERLYQALVAERFEAQPKPKATRGRKPKTEES